MLGSLRQFGEFRQFSILGHCGHIPQSRAHLSRDSSASIHQRQDPAEQLSFFELRFGISALGLQAGDLIHGALVALGKNGWIPDDVKQDLVGGNQFLGVLLAQQPPCRFID